MAISTRPYPGDVNTAISAQPYQHSYANIVLIILLGDESSKDPCHLFIAECLVKFLVFLFVRVHVCMHVCAPCEFKCPRRLGVSASSDVGTTGSYDLSSVGAGN